MFFVKCFPLERRLKPHVWGPRETRGTSIRCQNGLRAYWHVRLGPDLGGEVFDQVLGLVPVLVPVFPFYTALCHCPTLRTTVYYCGLLLFWSLCNVVYYSVLFLGTAHDPPRKDVPQMAIV